VAKEEQVARVKRPTPQPASTLPSVAAHRLPQGEGEIDQLVYRLSPSGMIYGLTEDEVKIVEVKK
jgi:hypothetical protein